MLKPAHKPAIVSVILTALLLLVNLTANAEALNLQEAPLAPGHNVYFQAVGLPDGISFTITGLRVNNGGNPTSYSTSFTTPDMSNGIGADPGSVFTYNGFPATVTVGNQVYQLVSTLPASGFTVGLSGGATTVVATYAASCYAPTVLVDPLSQTVVYSSPVTFTVSATGSAPLTYQWYSDGNQIPGANQSTYSIPYVLMSDAGLYHAELSNSCGTATSSQAQLTVDKANQVITFDQPASPAVYGTTFVVSPTASSGLPVYLVSMGSCTNSGYDVSMVSGTGDCVLVASQPGDGNYNPAGDVVRVVVAAKADQAISFPEPASPAVYGTTFTVTLSASSGLQVELVAAGGCSANGSVVTMTSGTTACSLTASQSGDDNYNPAMDVLHTVEATKADQQISFMPPSTPVIYGTYFDLVASASSGLTISFDITGVCELIGTTVSMTSGTGSCTISASQSGDDNYNPAAEVAHTVEAARASQTITFEQPPSPVKYQTSFNVAPASTSNLPVALAASGSCSSSGYTVTITKTSGACLLTASQAGDLNYLPAADVQRTVEPAPNGNIVYMPLLFGH